MSKPFSVHLKRLEKYVFQIDFGDFGDIITDEPEPLGNGEGPNPARLLAASVANCLAASLTFAIEKFKQDPGEITATVNGEPERIDGRWRIKHLQVEIKLGNPAENIQHLERVLNQFEEFCVVTQSVKEGIDVNVAVLDSNGKLLS